MVIETHVTKTRDIIDCLCVIFQPLNLESKKQVIFKHLFVRRFAVKIWYLIV